MTVSFLLSKVTSIYPDNDNMIAKALLRDGLLTVITKQILRKNWVLNFALNQQF